MSEDILIIEDVSPDIKVDPEEKVDVIQDNNDISFEKVGEDERSQDNKSDIFILDSNDSNNLRSNQVITMNKVYEDFDVTTLFYDGTLVGLSSTEFQLSDSILNYDYILFRWKGSNVLASGVDFFEIVDSNMFYNSIGDSKSKLTIGYRGTNAYGTRIINPREDPTKIGVSNSVLFNGTTNNNYNTLFAVYGLNIKTLSNNEVPSPGPSVSGDTIYNNYYITVSGDNLSSNIMEKPINEYNVQESLLLFNFIFIFGISLYLLVRRCIFKWR